MFTDLNAIIAGIFRDYGANNKIKIIMAKLKVKYTPIDPYYSVIEQTFIDSTIEGCELQQFEFEQWLGREHKNDIMSIYKVEILQLKY